MFLTSDLADYINGQIISIDGGETIKIPESLILLQIFLSSKN